LDEEGYEQKEYKGGVVVHEDDQARFDVLFTIKGPPFFQKVLSGL
jgi:hypothetical protein